MAYFSWDNLVNILQFLNRLPFLFQCFEEILALLLEIQNDFLLILLLYVHSLGSILKIAWNWRHLDWIIHPVFIGIFNTFKIQCLLLLRFFIWFLFDLDRGNSKRSEIMRLLILVTKSQSILCVLLLLLLVYLWVHKWPMLHPATSLLLMRSVWSFTLGATIKFIAYLQSAYFLLTPDMLVLSNWFVALSIAVVGCLNGCPWKLFWKAVSNQKLIHPWKLFFFIWWFLAFKVIFVNDFVHSLRHTPYMLRRQRRHSKWSLLMVRRQRSLSLFPLENGL